MSRYRSLTTELLALNRKADRLMRKISAEFNELMPSAEEQAILTDLARLERGEDLSLDELKEIMIRADDYMKVCILKAPSSERKAMMIAEYYNDDSPN